jgi:ribonuclease P protein subunit POP4
MQDPTDALKGELIGKDMEVVKAKNSSQKGITGKIIDETKNTLTIMDKKGIKKTLIKNTITIKVNNTEIRGQEIQAAPEERIKIKRKNDQGKNRLR